MHYTKVKDALPPIPTQLVLDDAKSSQDLEDLAVCFSVADG